MKIILWKARSSYLLYFYQYIVLIVIAIIAYSYSNILSYLAIIGLITFIVDAKTMRYELSDSTAFFSGSLLDREPGTVELKNIVGLYVMDAKPWSLFSLGTVLLITDLTHEAHPCIKAVKRPHELAKKIERLAIKQGAEL